MFWTNQSFSMLQSLVWVGFQGSLVAPPLPHRSYPYPTWAYFAKSLDHHSLALSGHQVFSQIGWRPSSVKVPVFYFVQGVWADCHQSCDLLHHWCNRLSSPGLSHRTECDLHHEHLQFLWNSNTMKSLVASDWTVKTQSASNEIAFVSVRHELEVQHSSSYCQHFASIFAPNW